MSRVCDYYETNVNVRPIIVEVSARNTVNCLVKPNVSVFCPLLFFLFASYVMYRVIVRRVLGYGAFSESFLSTKHQILRRRDARAAATPIVEEISFPFFSRRIKNYATRRTLTRIQASMVIRRASIITLLQRVSSGNAL